jgi:hypothetical protein
MHDDMNEPLMDSHTDDLLIMRARVELGTTVLETLTNPSPSYESGNLLVIQDGPKVSIHKKIDHFFNRLPLYSQSMLYMISIALNHMWMLFSHSCTRLTHLVICA